MACKTGFLSAWTSRKFSSAAILSPTAKVSRLQVVVLKPASLNVFVAFFHSLLQKIDDASMLVGATVTISPGGALRFSVALQVGNHPLVRGGVTLYHADVDSSIGYFGAHSPGAACCPGAIPGTKLSNDKGAG